MAIKIYIDQGHNPSGANAGAEGNGLREQDITYIVGKYLYDLLTNNPNFTARLSRPTEDTQLGTSNLTSLQARVNDANSWGANYFISIHTNGSTNPNANGTEVYVYREGSSAYYLGLDILNSIVNRLDMRNRGIFIRPSLYVLRKTTMPSLLVELGYISNFEDARKMENDPYGFAYAIYDGILEFFGL